MIIRSSETLKDDYRGISDLARELGEPIYITEDGEGDLVVMSIVAFEEWKQLSSLKSRLLLAEQSLFNGETSIPLAEVRVRLDEKYKTYVSSLIAPPCLA
ncbi:MAG: type II toxin-antitoxin system Phd/YefM family antitoxin [Defluviitaleaceae bacterium]|nr:type II toxin-antitoxin system Phd/YefM family antitoxin [Defluviitaleaceae bacterium]